MTRRLSLTLLPGLLLAALLAASAQVTPSDQLCVMLQLDNMLPDSNVFGPRAPEVDRQFALLEQAGVRWARVGIGWEQIEPAKGKRNWSAVDTIVAAARDHKVRLVWLLGNTAPWDSNNNDWNGVPNDLSSGPQE